MLVNDVSLRNLDPDRNSAKGFGFVQSKPPSAYTPVAVTPRRIRQSLGTVLRVDLPLLELHQRKAVW